MDKLMIAALATFNEAMVELIDACADLAEVDSREEGGAGSWESAMGYEQVLTRFAAARAAYLAIPDRE